MERFFATKWAPNVNKFKFVIVAVFAVWTIFAAWQASMVSPLTKQEDMIPRDHEWMVKLDVVTEEFNTGEQSANIQVFMYWGVSGLDKSGVGVWNNTDLGEIEWDVNFNLAPEANQQALLDMCSDLRD